MKADVTMKNQLINVSRMQQEAEHWLESDLMREAADFALMSRLAILSDGALKINFMTLVDLNINYALVSLPFVEMDGIKQFSRNLCSRMVEFAIQELNTGLEERYRHLLNGNFNQGTAEQQVKSWSLLKSLYSVGTDDRVSLREQAIALVAESIAPISEYEALTVKDVEECALSAPLSVLREWRDLASCACEEMRAAADMADAADRAEASWRKGTDLKFDFCSAQMNEGYWRIWNSVKERCYSEVDCMAQEIICQMLDA